MPDPNNFDDEQEWMKHCVPKVLEDGTAKDNDQAVAICMTMWSDQKSMDIKEIPSKEPDDYLIVEDREKVTTWHLQVKENGNPNHRLMGAAWAALHSGFRGNKYEGPGKEEAINKLKKLYSSEDLPLPGEKSLDLKVGARHNRTDKQALQDIHDAAITLGANCPDPTKWPQPKALIFDGSEVKALGDGRVGGYLIRFSTDKDPDLEGEYFTKDTDFGIHDKAPVYYQHGLDEKIGKRKLSMANIKFDDIGAWADTQLEIRDEYEKYIYKWVEEGKIGWSSGTASHLVEREKVGKSNWIKSWPIGLDASLTLTPAEPRNTAIPIKSLPFDIEAEGEVITAEVETDNKSDNLEPRIEELGDIKMEKDELIKILEERDAAKAKAAEEIAKREAEIKTAEESGYQKALEESKKSRKAGYSFHRVSGGREKSDGDNNEEVKSFLWWIRTGDDAPYKAAMQGQTDSEGGYYVPDQFSEKIIAKRQEGSVPAQIGVARFAANRDRILVPAEGTAATKFVVAAEEAAYDENEPTAAQVAITIHKMTKLIKISEELEEDSVADFGNYLAQVWGNSMAAADNYYLVASGTGTGMPQSMIAGGSLLYTTVGSSTAITAAEFIAALFSLGDPYAGEAVLIMKRDVLGYLRGLLVATPYAFVPQNDPSLGTAAARAHGSIFGVPVYCTAAMTGLTTGALVAATKHFILMNPNYYGVAERAGMTVTRNPYLYQANGQIGLFAKYRQGGAVLQSEGVGYIATKA